MESRCVSSIRQAFGIVPSRPHRHVDASLLALVSAVFLLAANAASAESMEDVIAIDSAEQGSIEEVVVIGTRPTMDKDLFRRLYEDPLRARIREELRQLEILEEEFAWRRDTVSDSVKPDRIRVGYDPRDALRAGLMPAEFRLPLDLVQPASLFGIDF
jgi:hypothetical protein